MGTIRVKRRHETDRTFFWGDERIILIQNYLPISQKEHKIKDHQYVYSCLPRLARGVKLSTVISENQGHIGVFHVFHVNRIC